MTRTIKTIKVKRKIIGEDKANICIPLVGKTEEELIAECENISTLKPDIIEWRVDYFTDVKDIQKVVGALRIIRDFLPDYPIVFTCRSAQEGGIRKIGRATRLDLAKAVIRTGLIDIIDAEMSNGSGFITEIITEAHNHNVYVTVSYHNFTLTPSKEAIIQILLDAQDMGADIAKVAVMPVNLKDVLVLLGATIEFKENYAKVPLVAISMSDKGTISRICGSLFGSSITFTSGTAASAPGQIPINELRSSIDILMRSV